MSRLAVLFFLISGPAMLLSLPAQHQHQHQHQHQRQESSSRVSLPTLHQDLREKSSSSKLVMMYDQHQEAASKNIAVIGSKKLTRSVTPRRLPPLNPDPSLSSGASPISIQARRGRSNRAQSEVQLQYERQHAFEVSLEQMLMEVENGAVWKKEEKQKKIEKDTKNKENPTTGWQKIWYKRLGWENLFLRPKS